MSKHPSQLPQRPLVEAALKATTLRLAAEMAVPQSQAPRWSAFEWRVALAVVAMHGIGALLARRLQWQGPALWAHFLADQQAQGGLRQARIESLLAGIDQAARHQGIALQRLKGAALLELGLHGRGERPMADLDLLVAPGDMEPASALLRDLGYRDDLDSSRHRSFSPAEPAAPLGFGEHADNPIRIELHDHVAEPLPVVETDITALIRTPRPRPGLNAYPDRLALMRHLLLHAAGNMRSRTLRLIQLQDLARLAPLLSPGDWAALLTEPSHGAWWALPPLSLLDHHFPGCLPRDLLHSLATDCPPVLRLAIRHADIVEASLSCPRIAAFPGLAWSRSPAEALGLIRARLWPSAVTRTQMRHLVATQPELASAGWTGRGQVDKLLRWTVGRPLRVPTLYSLQRAMAYEVS